MLLVIEGNSCFIAVSSTVIAFDLGSGSIIRSYNCGKCDEDDIITLCVNPECGSIVIGLASKQLLVLNTTDGTELGRC